MKDKKKKKLAQIEKLEKQEKQEKQERQEKQEKQEKQRSGDKPKKKKKEKEKRSKQIEKMPLEAGAEALPETEEESAADASVKRSQTKRKKPEKQLHAPLADDTAAALLFRAMGDDVRLRIVQLIHASGELCAADLLKSVSIVQSTLSHHMKILCESGVVACRRQGKWSYYSIDAQKLEEAAAYLETVAAAAK